MFLFFFLGAKELFFCEGFWLACGFVLCLTAGKASTCACAHRAGFAYELPGMDLLLQVGRVLYKVGFLIQDPTIALGVFNHIYIYICVLYPDKILQHITHHNTQVPY